MDLMKIGDRQIGDGAPCYVVAEIGQNHNGDMHIAKALIREAAQAGVDAVKFQKRTLELCIPKEQQAEMRDTPWGRISYLDYRRHLEFERVEQWQELIVECDARGVQWFASCWDVEAVRFIEQFDPVAHKVASATLTDVATLDAIKSTERPIIVSTGMSDSEDVGVALRNLNGPHGWSPYIRSDLAILHCNSTYPCAPADVNLRCIQALAELYETIPIGYSGHETGLAISLAAVAMGACILERHFTLDRAAWGTDHAASVEPQGMRRLVRDVRVIEAAMGDGVKRVTDGERAVMKKLRRAK